MDNVLGLLEHARVEGPTHPSGQINALLDTATVILDGSEMTDDGIKSARVALLLTKQII